MYITVKNILTVVFRCLYYVECSDEHTTVKCVLTEQLLDYCLYQVIILPVITLFILPCCSPALLEGFSLKIYTICGYVRSIP